MNAVIQILIYLKSSPGKGLMLTRNNHLLVEGHIDVDWTRNISDRKSTSSYCMLVRGNLVFGEVRRRR